MAADPAQCAAQRRQAIGRQLHQEGWRLSAGKAAAQQRICRAQSQPAQIHRRCGVPPQFRTQLSNHHIHRQFCAAGHKGQQLRGLPPLAFTRHGPDCHGSGNGASQPQQQRNTGPSAHTDPAENAVRQENDPRHDATVLQNREVQHQDQHRRKKCRHAAHARDQALRDQVIQPCRSAHACKKGRHRSRRRLHASGYKLRQSCPEGAKDKPEHPQHRCKNQRRTHDGLQHDPVQPRR